VHFREEVQVDHEQHKLPIGLHGMDFEQAYFGMMLVVAVVVGTMVALAVVVGTMVAVAVVVVVVVAAVVVGTMAVEAGSFEVGSFVAVGVGMAQG